ncbi:unnamed protein product [Sphagnum balticum]
MKLVASALLFAFALAGSTNGQGYKQVPWDIVSSLPSGYTGLPFNLELTNGPENYQFKGHNVPQFATLDTVKGVITGQSSKAGAYPFSVDVTDNSGDKISQQYILNVVDVNTASQDVWANTTSNYYDRPVTNPFQVVPDSSAATIINAANNFNYNFKTNNAVGSPVFAFLNLPQGLTGDANTGIISGQFAASGIYTLGVEAADQGGNTAEGFVTVTVQGAQGATSGGVSSLNQVTVENSVPFVFDLDAVHNQQVEADKLLFDALAVVNDAKA